jgi:electron transport complex protein RnfD
VERFLISSSPHLKKSDDVPRIMWRVNLALAPAGIWAIGWFGFRAFLVIFLCSLGALASEAICQHLKGVRVARKEGEGLPAWLWRWLTATLGDGSALVTGLLLAYVLPPTLPWYVCVLGGIVAIGLCKHAFGGLGYNIWNPALMARAFLLAGYAGLTVMSAWPVLHEDAAPFTGDLDATTGCVAEGEAPEGVSEATTLFDPKVADTLVLADGTRLRGTITGEAADALEFRTDSGEERTVPRAAVAETTRAIDEWRAERAEQLKPMGALLLGQMGRCVGEVGFVWLLLGGLYLIWRGHVDWRVPVVYVVTVLVLGWVMPEKIYLVDGKAWSGWFAGNPVHHLFGGGLILGAFFMATDMVTSPVTRKGMIIFALGCGVITAIIRLYGGYPEGVCYSIILMNTAVPLIDRFTKPRIYGAVETDEDAD